MTYVSHTSSTMRVNQRNRSSVKIALVDPHIIERAQIFSNICCINIYSILRQQKLIQYYTTTVRSTANFGKKVAVELRLILRTFIGPLISHDILQLAK